MKVARVIFVGTPALPLPVQDQIAKSLTEHDYDDDQEGLNDLLERTRDAWQSQGYFKVSVELSGSQTLEETPERKTVAITVNVDAGKQYRLDQIQFRASASSNHEPSQAEGEPFSTEQLRAFFPIKPGEIFDIHKLQIGTDELRKAYGTKGFIYFAPIPTFNINEASDLITLIVEMDKSKQFHIGTVQVLGADPQVAQALMKDPRLARGTVFDISILKDLKVHWSFKPKDDVERRLNEQRGIVDLTIDLRDCTR